MLYLPNSTSALIDGEFRGHQEGQEHKPHQNEVANRVSRNLAWQLLTSVSSLPCCLHQWKDVGASFAALALHLENRWFSSPPRFFILLQWKANFILYSAQKFLAAGLSCCGAFGPSPKQVHQGRHAEPHTPPSLVSQAVKEFGQSTLPALSVNRSGPGRCPQTWLLQRQWKGWIVMGVLSFHLAAAWFWQNLGIFKKLCVLCKFVFF